MVLSICESKWRVNNKDLTVCPNFSCFQEAPEDQVKRILSETKNASTDQTKTKNNWNCENEKKELLDHCSSEKMFDIPTLFSFIKVFLDVLRFENAMKEKKVVCTFTKSSTAWKLLLKGSDKNISKITKLLDYTIHKLEVLLLFSSV